MTLSIVIHADQNGRMERTRILLSTRPNPHGNGYSNPTRVSVTLLERTRAGAREVASIRIRVGSGRAHRCSLTTKANLARLDFQSAAPSPLRSVIAAESSPGGGMTAGSMLPFWRGSRLFNSCGAFKALRKPFSFLRIAIQPLQKSFRIILKSCHGISSLLPSVEQHDRRMRQGVGNQPQGLGKRTQELVKVGQGNE